MKSRNVLSREQCHQLESGYYFFDNVDAIEELTFDNLRTVALDEAFQHLKESIVDQGVRVPIQVSFNKATNKLVVLAGERRSRAVSQLRRDSDQTHEIKLPCLVHVTEGSDADQKLDQLVTAVVSNLHAQDLSQVEKMRCYLALYQKGMNKKEIARCCGKDRKTVERCLQLAEFDQESLAYIEEKEKQGLLKSRHVEIIGQKLKKSLDQARQNLAESDADVAAAEGKDIQRNDGGAEQEIRAAARKVLEEHVRRSEEVKKPKSEDHKQKIKIKRINLRRIDIAALEERLAGRFEGDQIRVILSIIEELHRNDRPTSATTVVGEEFAKVMPDLDVVH